MTVLSRDSVRAWLVSRAAVLALMAFTHWLLVRHGIGRPGLRPGDAGLFTWDGDWYRRIAAHGYATDDMLRFFPLVALPGRLLSPLGPIAAGVAVVAVANASALAYAEGLARLTAFELRDATAARWAPWLALLNPASYVLVLAYAEATFAALAVWCFWALRHRAWLPAAGLAFLGGLARPVGAVLMLPAAVEAWRSPGPPWRRALAVAAAPLGCLAYLAWVGVARGDPLLPFRVQQSDELRRGVLASPLGEWGRVFAGDGTLAASSALLWAPLVLAGLVLVARRLPASYTAFTAVLLVVAFGTPKLSSFERYVLAAFPLLMVAAGLRSRGVRLVTLIVCCLGLAGYSVLAFAHRYVP